MGEKFVCNLCGRELKNQSSLTAHVNYYCKNNTDIVAIVSVTVSKIIQGW